MFAILLVYNVLVYLFLIKNIFTGFSEKLDNSGAIIRW